MRDLKANKGITLIALVVTIIVLLILAAVTINLVLGQNGIIGKAQSAQSKTEEAEARDQAQLEWLDLQVETKGESVSAYAGSLSPESKQERDIKEVGSGYVVITKNGYDFKISDNGTIEMLRKIDAKYIPEITSKITTDTEGNNVAGENVSSGTELYIVFKVKVEGTIDEVKIGDTVINADANGKYVYKIIKNGKYTVKITTNKGKEYECEKTEDIVVSNYKVNEADIVSVANTPKVKAESGMKAVRYNSGTWSEADKIKTWYSYEPQTGTTENGGTSEWANAMTKDESMWVWIPRYAYKITNGKHGDGLTYSSDNITTEAGTINVIFLKGTSNTEYIDKETGETKTLPDGYTVHPTFTTNADNGGGWNQELEGIWVAKFEASSVEGNSNDAGDNVTTKTLQAKPNVSSWRNIQIGNMWTVAREAKYGLTDSTQINNLNSHMMKNSEWGAVAYLSHSKYGRNGTEISINNSSDFYTGRSAGAPGSSSTSISSAGTYQYNTTAGVLASTTGNVYGIYDMSGGAWEYIASYVNTGKDNLDYGSSFATKDKTQATSNEYVTVYNGSYQTNFAMGDSIYEISKVDTSSSIRASWFSDLSRFPAGELPFFGRGGNYDSGSDAGIFSFNYNGGINYTTNGFRPVIVIM